MTDLNRDRVASLHPSSKWTHETGLQEKGWRVVTHPTMAAIWLLCYFRPIEIATGLLKQKPKRREKNKRKDRIRSERKEKLE